MPENSSNKFSMFKKGANSFFFDVFTYSTVRSASVKSLRVGIVYRFAQLLLLIYIVGWELIHKKGYQTFETESSVVTTKVKGQGFVPINQTIDRSLNISDPLYFEKLYSLNKNISYKIVDTADYIIPPSEYNSIFIMTNYIETIQNQDVCDEEYNKNQALCQTDEDCQNLRINFNTWSGIPTGRCVPSTMKNDTFVCEVRAWCPTEKDSFRNEDTLIRNVLNYTIFIKNDIEFKKFYKKCRNIIPNITNKYISKCIYDPVHDRFCPVFKLDNLLNTAEPDNKEKYKMLLKGGVILIEIIWNCDFDFRDTCYPEYSFKRFDAKQNTSSGFNFRFANKFRVNGVEYRILYKAFGLRFIINVSGTAGKFNIVPLMLTIGAGLGLMSLSVVVGDCVLLNCTKNKKLYQKMKDLDLQSKKDFNIEEIELRSAALGSNCVKL